MHDLFVASFEKDAELKNKVICKEKMLYPLKFNPIYKEKIWGGENLKNVLGKDIPTAKTGESWEISDHDEDTSVIANGELAGKSLHWVMENHRKELVGEGDHPKFPLLFKFLDAADDLSVQVHPDDAYADKYKSGELGKTEAWYIVHVEPGAKLIAGLKQGTTKENFAAAIKDNTVERYLHRVEVKKGDVIFIPAGRVHAIMQGIVLNEIQQNSDTTFRVSDWGRVGFDGKPRQLHVKEAVDVTNFNDYEPGIEKKDWIDEGKNRYAVIVDCEYFSIEEHEITEEKDFRCSGNFRAISVLEGSFSLKCGDFALDCTRGESILVPAVCDTFAVVPKEPIRLLSSFAL